VLIRSLILFARKLTQSNGSKPSITPPARPRYVYRNKNQRRRESLSGIYYLRKSLHIWQLVLWSFALDILLFAVLSEVNATSMLALPINETLIGAIIVAVLGTMRGSVVSFSDTLRAAQFKFAKSKVALPLLIAIVLIPLGELVIKLGDIGASSMLILAAIIAAAGFSIYRQINLRREQNAQFERDAVSRIEELNKQNFVIALVPIVCARIVGLTGVFAALISENPILMFVLYETLAIVMYANLRPITDQFLIRCNRCASWASRPFKHYHCCPSCSTDFHADKAKALRERLSAPGSISKEEIEPRSDQIQIPVEEFGDQCQAKKPRRFFELALSRAASSKRSKLFSPAPANEELNKPLPGKG
jgi:hypothetical protein